jgi:inner membrane protein YidH
VDAKTPGATPLKSSTELADDRTRMALDRTLVAQDRTLLAWVRTATSMISFGFTIYKFFQSVQQATPDTPHLIGPRGLAMVMIAIGVGGLTIATIEYRVQMKQLHTQYVAYGPFRRSLAAGVAMTIATLGVLGFVLVVFRQ